MKLADKKAALQELLKREDISFRHLRTRNSGSITVAFNKDGDKIQDAAFIFCNPNENFSFVEGRFRAAMRLVAGRSTFIRKGLNFNVKDSGLDIKFLQNATFVRHPRWFSSFIPAYLREAEERRAIRAMRKIAPDTF